MAAQGYIGRSPGDSSNVIARQTYTPTGITTDFTFASTYSVGYIDVYLNGVRLVEGNDFTATDGSVVGLTTHAQNGDIIELVAYKAFNATNVTAANNNFSVGGNLSVTGVSTFTGAITATGGITGAVTGDATGLTGTPDITIRNLTGVAATFTGVLSYDDVTNVDSVGYATFRSGINVQGAGSTTTTLNVSGVTTMTGDANFGSVLNIDDSIVHSGDSNTKIRFPAADTFSVETSGNEALRVDSSQRLVVGANASVQVAGSHPFIQHHGNKTTTNLAIAGYANNLGGSILALGASRSTTVGTPGTIVANGDILGDIRFAGDDGTDINSIGAAIRGEVDGAPGSNDMPGRLLFLTTADGAASATERLRIDSSGRVIIGHDSSEGSNRKLQVAATDSSAGLEVFRYVTNANSAPSVTLSRSNSGTLGTNTLVGDDQAVGYVQFKAANGSAYNTAAQIVAFVDGAPGVDDMPGRLTFQTTADGASSPTERLRIDSSGNVGINETNPTDFLQILPTDGKGITLKTTQNHRAQITADSNRSGADNAILAIRGNWNGTGVAAIEFTTADDTSNKDDGNILFKTAASGGNVNQRMQINRNGQILINGAGDVFNGRTGFFNDTGGSGTQLQIEGSIYAYSSMSITRNGTGTSGPVIILAKGRGGTTVASSGDEMGKLSFQGAEGGGNMVEGAKITSEVDGTPGSNDMPGRLLFFTTADGASTSTERLRITSGGDVGIGTTIPTGTVEEGPYAAVKDNTSTLAVSKVVALSNRNLVDNGAMRISQREVTLTYSASAPYLIDRFQASNFLESAVVTTTQESDAPEGFTKSLKMDFGTGDTPASGSSAGVIHKIEGQDLQHLKYGDSDAQSMTVSFYVKSNKTGGASFEILQPDNSNKLFSTSYTINSANTWEYKTITIPGDTSGVINDDTGVGLQLFWWINSGSSFRGGSYQTTWGTIDNTNRNVSNLNVGSANNDYYQITGIQLELGTQATPFEHRSFGDYLERCLRYYETSYNWLGGEHPGLDGSGNGDANTAQLYMTSPDGLSFQPGVHFRVPKRTNPTVELYSTDGTFGNWRKWNTANETAAAAHISFLGFLPQISGATANVFYAGQYVAIADLP